VKARQGRSCRTGPLPPARRPRQDHRAAPEAPRIAGGPGKGGRPGRQDRPGRQLARPHPGPARSPARPAPSRVRFLSPLGIRTVSDLKVALTWAAICLAFILIFRFCSSPVPSAAAVWTAPRADATAKRVGPNDARASAKSAGEGGPGETGQGFAPGEASPEAHEAEACPDGGTQQRGAPRAAAKARDERARITEPPWSEGWLPGMRPAALTAEAHWGKQEAQPLEARPAASPLALVILHNVAEVRKESRGTWQGGEARKAGPARSPARPAPSRTGPVASSPGPSGLGGTLDPFRIQADRAVSLAAQARAEPSSRPAACGLGQSAWKGAGAAVLGP